MNVSLGTVQATGAGTLTVNGTGGGNSVAGVVLYYAVNNPSTGDVILNSATSTGALGHTKRAATGVFRCAWWEDRAIPCGRREM